MFSFFGFQLVKLYCYWQQKIKQSLELGLICEHLRAQYNFSGCNDRIENNDCLVERSMS